MAVQHSIRNEDEECWRTHYAALKAHYPGMDTKAHGNITDQEKGLEAARKHECPSSSGFFCALHRKPNAGKYGGGKATADAYEQAVYAYSERKFAYAKAQMSAAARTYLEKIPDEEQYLRSAHLAGVVLRDYATQSIAESFNNKLTAVGVRHVPIMDSALKVVQTIQNDLLRVAEECAKCTDAVPPRIRKMLLTGGETGKLVEHYACKWQDKTRTVAHVAHRDHPSVYSVVNMSTGTCTCCRPEVVRGPFCVHLAVAANSAGRSLAWKLEDIDKTAHWKAQCEKALSATSGVISVKTSVADMADVSSEEEYRRALEDMARVGTLRERALLLARTRAQLRVAERAATRATEVSGRAREVSFDVTDMLYDACGYVRGVRHRMRAEVHPAGPRVLDDVDNAERVLDRVIELWDEVS